MIQVKVLRWPEKNTMICKIGVLSHHLQSLLGVIELIILCAFACILGIFYRSNQRDYNVQKDLTYLPL